MNLDTVISKKLSQLLFNSFASEEINGLKSDKFTDINLFEQFVYEELRVAITLFENFYWYRHAELFNSKLAEILKYLFLLLFLFFILINLFRKFDKESAFKCVAKNLIYYLNGQLKSNNFINYAKQLFVDYREFLQKDSKLYFLFVF